jgi:AcrR family transcriptional regulator
MPRHVNGPQSASSTPTSGDAGSRIELPVLGVGVVRERADAARNRRAVLAAAEELFAARGVGAVTMDDVAAAAGVGKGTLYRRFGDKSGLAMALLDERERELQHRMLSGPPPLGPGAEPAERLAAFVASYLELVAAQLDLVLLSQTSTPGARMHSGAHAFWRRHCHYLLAGAGAGDPDLRADMLLAALTAEQVRHWLCDEGQELPALTNGVCAAVVAWCQPPS